MGYSLADTALVALISRYASPATQGRSLGLNQAAQSMARVISPVVSMQKRETFLIDAEENSADGRMLLAEWCCRRKCERLVDLAADFVKVCIRSPSCVQANRAKYPVCSPPMSKCSCSLFRCSRPL